MGVIQHHLAMDRQQPVDLGPQGLVVGDEPACATGGDLGQRPGAGDLLVLVDEQEVRGVAGEQTEVMADHQHANATLALKNLRPWTVSVGIRYIGPAPLVENNAVRSTSNLTTNLRIARQWTREVEVSLDLLNVTDRQNNDMSYLYVSRVNGEPTGVSGVHVHPAEPRAIRLHAQVTF